MRKTLLLAAACGAMLILPACATDYYGAAATGPRDVYYDGYYGPYTDGYWGPDAYFYYRGGDGRFIRDDRQHFQHGRFHGARVYQAGHAPNRLRDYQ